MPGSLRPSGGTHRSLPARAAGSDRCPPMAPERDRRAGARGPDPSPLQRVRPRQRRVRRSRRAHATATGGPAPPCHQYGIRSRHGNRSPRRGAGPPRGWARRGHRHQPPCPELCRGERPATHADRPYPGVGPGLFLDGRAHLVVCNPPWLPVRPTGPLEQGVYDPNGTVLHSFLAGLSARLRAGGEGWLVLSDLAEHLGLRERRHLLDGIRTAQLRVVDKIDTKPRHPRTKDTADPLHTARSAETTSLRRLAPAP